jgi:hypothetical protein
MKTVTVREFYHNAGLVDGLAEGKTTVGHRQRQTKVCREQERTTKDVARIGGKAGGRRFKVPSVQWDGFPCLA